MFIKLYISQVIDRHNYKACTHAYWGSCFELPESHFCILKYKKILN